MRKIALFLLLTIFIFPALAIEAKAQSLKIAAIVNDDVITEYDLNNRMKFIIFSTRVQPDQATVKRIQNQALRALIDEKLKLQVAKEHNIVTASPVINKEIGKMEQRNKMPSGQLPVLLKQNNIDVQTLRDRIEADLSWTKYVGRNLRRKARVTEDQVDDELDIISSQQNQTQKRVFEIFLPLDSSELETETRATALELKKELNEGVPFTTLARNYSKSTSAQLGGDRGWLSPGQLPENLDAIVQQLPVGSVSDPIETLTGLYLFQVTAERNLTGDAGQTELGLVQLSARTTDSITQDVLLGRLNGLKSEINSCDAALNVAESNPDISSTQTDKILLKDLSDLVRKQVDNLKAGETSSPIPIPDAAILLTVCSRKEPKSNLPSRREIRKQLVAVKLDILARQRLRDLRNAAFIDIRN